jgi:hypothetical protein
MTALIVRVLSSLVSATFAAHLIVRSRIWYEGVPSAQVHLEAVLLGVFSGLLIASIVSLIKLLLSGFLVSTQSEILFAHLSQLSNEGDEHHPGDMFHSQIQPREDLRREYSLVDTLEIEMQKEMVG